MKYLSPFVWILFFSASLQAQVVITAVYDGPLTGGQPKGVELYVLEDIQDLSDLGIGSATNGGGSDSIEYGFPPDQAPEGSYLYVTADTAAFRAFFGFGTTYLTNAMLINGDDAIELFWNGTVIDVFGDINVDGTGQNWEYTDGWAARKPLTGPDGSVFILANWNFSGIDALDGETSNATASIPVPIQSYDVSVEPDVTVLAQNLQFIPRDITIEVGQTVRWTNPETTIDHNVNGMVSIYPCNPVSFFSGVAITGPWDFDVTFTAPGLYDYQCDPHVDCCDMVGTVTVIDPLAPAYPAYPVSRVTSEDANGVADSLETYCTLEGIVYGANLRTGGLQFALIDDTGNGIGVFEGTNTCYAVTEGDRIRVQGQITQFSGLTQINNQARIEVLSQGNPLLDPVLVDNLDESTESRYVKLEDVFIDSVQSSGSGFNVFGSNNNGVHVIRLDIDVFPDESYATGLLGKTVTVTGTGGQFDTSEPFTDGYQILPGSAGQIEEVSATGFLAASHIQISPNPVSDRLTLITDFPVLYARVFSMNGLQLLAVEGDVRILDLRHLINGLFVIQVQTAEGVWTGRVVKME